MIFVYGQISLYRKVDFGIGSVSDKLQDTVRLGKTKWGTLPQVVRIKINGPVLKALRSAIKLIELYCATKSF